MSLFAQGPPAPSNPVNVPSRNSNHTSKDTRLSTSAPPSQWVRGEPGDAGNMSPAANSLFTQASFPNMRARLDSDVGPSLSAAGSQTLLDEVDGGDGGDMDDFDRLRSVREQHRREKYLQRLMARSVSAQQPTGSLELIDNDLLLQELIKQSQKQQTTGGDSKEETT